MLVSYMLLFILLLLIFLLGSYKYQDINNNNYNDFYVTIYDHLAALLGMSGMVAGVLGFILYFFSDSKVGRLLLYVKKIMDFSVNFLCFLCANVVFVMGSVTFFSFDVVSYTMRFVILILPLVCALLAVAFYTLLERKLLGYIMLRKGPNKVGFMGILQPFSDAGKLFCKEVVVPRYANFIPFILCPTFVLGISLTLWIMYPFKHSELIFVCGLIQFLVISSMSVYGTMVAGWSSNSKYALLGAVRSVAQSISYEVPMSFIILCFIYGCSSFMLQEIGMFQNVIVFFFPFLPCCVLWIICILAETNRAPFDFVEGESELVSGFNVEYSGGAFAMIYMAEYSSMLFNSMVSSVLFFGSSEIFMSIMCMLFVVGFVWVRGTMPRMRYDKLMKLCWTVVLCVSMCVACVIMCYSFL